MKKFMLSLLLTVVFGAYVLHSKGEENETPVITPPVQNTGSLSSSNTSSSNGPTKTPLQARSQGQYRDGSYTGQSVNVFYGNIQVQAVISQGRLADVKFLQFPNDRMTSMMINQQALPILRSEALTSQNAQVDIVSGATDSSQGFQQSLSSALSQAQ